MVKISENYLEQQAKFNQAGIKVPSYDHAVVTENGLSTPQWIHFGGGNLFRAFHAAIADKLLENGQMQSGIWVVDTYTPEVTSKIYNDNNNQVLRVITKRDGTLEKQLLGSIAQAIFDSAEQPSASLIEAFKNPSLQLATFSITEKGYALNNPQGDLSDVVMQDIVNGPQNPVNNIARLTALLWQRFNAGGYPIALVSTDNFSQNGDLLKHVVLKIAQGWADKGHVSVDFLTYLSDKHKVSFPLSMIDRITPAPSVAVSEALTAVGIEDMALFKSSKGIDLANFANTEETNYLVIEDAFPNGEPGLATAGVILTSRNTVNDVDEMKVTTSLNPLHTALAIYGMLLGYESIADEMTNDKLVQLIKKIGYVEGLPVVKDPGVINPKKFIDEVVNERLPNKYIPDTPQRIATDTSQKLAVRYGVTIQHYLDAPDKDVQDLTYIPLVIAGWLRYLLGVNDAGEVFKPSSDPKLEYLQGQLAPITLGFTGELASILNPILADKELFGLDLVQANLADKIMHFFKLMIIGPGAVEQTLTSILQDK